MTLAQIFGVSGGGILLLLTLIQIAPIKVKPLSALAKWFGRAINREMMDELEKINRKLDNHIKDDDEDRANGYRAFILRFNLELLRGIRHTRENFVEVLDQITKYKAYCDTHENYKNERAVFAIANIERVYAERLQKHDFREECQNGN